MSNDQLVSMSPATRAPRLFCMIPSTFAASFVLQIASLHFLYARLKGKLDGERGSCSSPLQNQNTLSAILSIKASGAKQSPGNRVNAIQLRQDRQRSDITAAWKSTGPVHSGCWALHCM